VPKCENGFPSEKRHSFEALAALIERIVNPKANVVHLHDARLPAADRGEQATDNVPNGNARDTPSRGRR
jgi:hypothetical protein